MVPWNKVLVVCSAGGHMKEALSAMGRSASGFHLATYRTGECRVINSRYVLHYLTNPHLSKLKYLKNFVQSFFLLLRVHPKVIITTGAGIAIPTALLGKMLGVKLIVVDTMALVDKLSKTGEFLYRYADLFVVQWPKLLEKYPKAIYGGLSL